MLSKVLEDLNYIAAMGPPGGGRNNVDPRFIALFNVYNLTPPTEEVRTSHTTPSIDAYTTNALPRGESAQLHCSWPILLRNLDKKCIIACLPRCCVTSTRRS